MKMIIAIIHDEDSHRLMNRLSKEGVMATKLASTGGLLRTGNTTFFIGIDEEKVEPVVQIIKEECQTTKQMSLINPPISNMPEGFMSYPVEVTVGGATLFVIDVDQYLKI